MNRTAIYMATGIGCVLLPLLGVGIVGRDIGQYLEFPPLTRYVEHHGFSSIAFCVMALVDCVLFAPLAMALWRRRTVKSRCDTQGASFPWWGWLGLVVCGISWFLAWNRFPWFTLFQRHTFLPLWFGYILIANGIACKRSGTSPLQEYPIGYALLFPLSALFWWLFEYFNRFVQNWFYLGISDFTKGEYIWYATLSFSTVLPAVVATRSVLLTYGAFQGLENGRPLRVPHEKQSAAALLSLCFVSLFLVGVYPSFFFPFVWVSPLLILETLLILANHRSLLSSLQKGNWQNVGASAAAALICGFFWELWNINSLAQWGYSIPFVDRFHIFAMPLLGFGGYLPFGIECTRVSDIALEIFSQNKISKRRSDP